MSSTESKLTIIQKLAETAPVKIVNLPEVAERFQQLYVLMNGGNQKTATLKYEAEKFHFAKMLQEKPALQNCTKLSLYGCFLDAAVNGLSFDPAMKHLYVISYKHKVQKKDESGVSRETWEERASLQIAGPGELTMRVAQGQIKYADNAVLVYEGDVFKQGIRGNQPFVDHEAVFPRQTDNIIAAYIRITRIDGTVDFKVMGVQEVLNLKQFSKDPNSLAWTKGFPGMVLAKVLKFAFGSYPKVKLGQFSKLQSEIIDESKKEIPVDYGMPGAELPGSESNDTFMPEQTQTEEIKHIDVAETTPITNLPDDQFVQEPVKNKATTNFDDDDF